MSGFKGETDMEFYALCIKEFHEVLHEKGYLKKEPVYIPELILLGNRAIFTYLQDERFHQEAGDNAVQYYYIICSLSYMTGIAYADMWHKDYNALVNGFEEKILTKGAPDYAQTLLEAEIGVKLEKQAEELFSTVYDRWLELHEPYWELEDPRKYTICALLAVYQAGISTILGKYGY